MYKHIYIYIDKSYGSKVNWPDGVSLTAVFITLSPTSFFWGGLQGSLS